MDSYFGVYGNEALDSQLIGPESPVERKAGAFFTSRDRQSGSGCRARGASARRIARASLACGGQNRFVLGVRFLRNGVIMAKRTKRREWTKKHVRELKTLARQKTPAARIAKSLKRIVGATRQKAFSLGVSLDSRG